MLFSQVGGGEELLFGHSIQFWLGVVAVLGSVFTTLGIAVGGVVAWFITTRNKIRVNAFNELTNVMKRKDEAHEEERKRVDAERQEEHKRIDAERHRVDTEREEERKRYDIDRQADHKRFSDEITGMRSRYDLELTGVRQLNGLLQTQFNDAMKQLDTVRGEGHTRSNKLQEKISGIEAEHMMCQKELAILRSQVQSVAIQTGSTLPTSMIGGVLIVGTDGIVRDYSELLSTFLGWEPSEVIGRPVEMVVPERLLEQFREAFAKAAKSGFASVPAGRVMDTWMRVRTDNENSRQEIPVTITLRAWAGGGFVTGTIRPRMITPPTEAKVEKMANNQGA